MWDASPENMRDPAILPFVVCNMRIKELLNEGIRRLAAAGIEETASDAWILFAWMKQVDRTFKVSPLSPR